MLEIAKLQGTKISASTSVQKLLLFLYFAWSEIYGGVNTLYCSWPVGGVGPHTQVKYQKPCFFMMNLLYKNWFVLIIELALSFLCFYCPVLKRTPPFSQWRATRLPRLARWTPMMPRGGGGSEEVLPRHEGCLPCNEQRSEGGVTLEMRRTTVVWSTRLGEMDKSAAIHPSVICRIPDLAPVSLGTLFILKSPHSASHAH